MGKDYYKILEINRDSTQAQIAQGYRSLALKYHPSLTKENKNQGYSNFCLISEAFEVLSDPLKREFYDLYGEEKLKDGCFEDGCIMLFYQSYQELIGGYSFGGNPEEIFEKFFGCSNIFAQIYDTHGDPELASLFSHAFGNFKQIQPPKDVIVPIYCTLNELYNGCSKEIQYQRTVLNKDEITTSQVQETRVLEIKQGYDNSQKIYFKELGNEAAGMKTSDTIFELHEQPHPDFQRKGNDLIHIARITLQQALFSEPFELRTLDGRKLFISMDQVINPKTVKIVENEGMPIFNKDEFTVKNFQKVPQKGNLYIKFDIKFPTHIESEQKEQIRQLLGQ